MKQQKCSKVHMSVVSSSGVWLNGCLQPQHYYVDQEITDPEGQVVARVSLTYEQLTRMLLSNGFVECTLTRYRKSDGTIGNEEVQKPETIQKRMTQRLGDVQQELLDRTKDLVQDTYEMINGAKRGKSEIKELHHNLKVLLDFLQQNTAFVAQQAEEEVLSVQENAKGQLAMFIQSLVGSDQQTIAKLDSMLAESEVKQLSDKTVESHTTDYKCKNREKKAISDMTAMEVADQISIKLRLIEKALGSDNKKLYMSQAIETKGNVALKYISFQGSTTVDLESAKMYLKYLCVLKDPKEFKHHFRVLEG